MAFVIPAHCPCESRLIGEPWAAWSVATPQTFEAGERRGKEYFFESGNREIRVLAALVLNSRETNPKRRAKGRRTSLPLNRGNYQRAPYCRGEQE